MGNKKNRPPAMEEILQAYPKLSELAQLFLTDDPVQMVEVARALINAVSGREVLAMVTFQPGSGQARLTVWPHNASFDEVEAALDAGKRIVIERRIRTELEGTKDATTTADTDRHQPASGDRLSPDGDEQPEREIGPDAGYPGGERAAGADGPDDPSGAEAPGAGTGDGEGLGNAGEPGPQLAGLA